MLNIVFMNMLVNLPVVVRLSEKFVYKKFVNYTHLSDENLSDADDNGLLSVNNVGETSRQHEAGSQGLNDNDGCVVVSQEKAACSAVAREVNQSPTCYKTKIV